VQVLQGDLYPVKGQITGWATAVPVDRQTAATADAAAVCERAASIASVLYRLAAVGKNAN